MAEEKKTGAPDDTEVKINLTARDKATKQINDVIAKLNALGAAAESLERNLGTLNDRMNKQTKEQKSVEKQSKKTEKSTKKLTTSTDKLAKSIGRIAFYRAVRTFLKFLTTGIQENIDLMAQMNDSVNETMSRFNSSAKVTQASVALMAVPFYDIANLILPDLAKGLANIAESFSFVIGLFKGERSYLKVNTQYWEDYAESIDQAKKQLFGFDKFNSLNATENPGDLFTEVEYGSEGMLKDIENLSTFALTAAGAFTAVNLLIKAFKSKNKTLKEQTDATNADTQAVGEMATSMAGAKNAVGALAGVAGIGLLLGKLGELAKFGKNGDTPLDIQIGLGVPAGAELALSDLGAKLAELQNGFVGVPGEMEAEFEHSLADIEVAFNQMLMPLPGKFASKTTLQLFHLGQEVRSEAQAMSEASAGYFQSAANSMYLSYKNAIDKTVAYYNSALAGKETANPVTTPSVVPSTATGKANLPSLFAPLNPAKNESKSPAPASQGYGVADVAKLYGSMALYNTGLYSLGDRIESAAEDLGEFFEATADDWIAAFKMFLSLVPAAFGIPAFAGGGIASSGTLFRAGENGAEVVSYLGGGNTGVMNIEQFEEASYRGVSRALYDNRSIFEQELHGDVYMNGDRVGKVTASGVYKEGVRVGYFEKK